MLHVAMRVREDVEQSVLNALGSLLDVFARRASLVVSGRAGDGRSVVLDGRAPLVSALEGCRVVPSDAAVRTTHVASWEGPGLQLSLQVWRDEPWSLTCDAVWEDGANLGEEVASSLIGPFDFVSVGFAHRARGLPRIGRCVFVAKHLAAAYQNVWGHGDDVDNAVRFRFVRGSESSLGTREAERRAVDARLPIIAIPRLQDVLGVEHRPVTKVPPRADSLPTYLRTSQGSDVKGCCASRDDEASGTPAASASPAEVSSTSRAQELTEDDIRRLLATPPEPSPVHASTEEIDFEEVRRRAGRELPDGFTKARDDASTDTEGPMTTRMSRPLEEGMPHAPPVRGRPSAPQEDEGSGTVLARPSREVLAARAAFGQKLTPVRVPELTVDQYAELVATLEVGGAPEAATWRRFGVFSAESKRALDDLFADLFRQNPTELERFQGWLIHQRERLRREGGPR